MTKKIFYFLLFFTILFPVKIFATEIFIPKTALVDRPISTAVLLGEGEKESKITVSIFGKMKQLISFAEYKTDENGFGTGKMNGISEVGKYSAELTIDDGKQFKKKSFEIEVINKNNIYLTAKEINNEKESKIIVFGCVNNIANKNSVSSNITCTLQDQDGNKITKNEMTNKNGVFVFKINTPLIFKGKKIEINIATENSSETKILQLQKNKAYATFLTSKFPEIVFKAKYADGRPASNIKTDIGVKIGQDKKIFTRETDIDGEYTFQLDYKEQNVPIKLYAQINIFGEKITIEKEIKYSAIAKKENTEKIIKPDRKIFLDQNPINIEINDPEKKGIILNIFRDGFLSESKFILAKNGKDFFELSPENTSKNIEIMARTKSGKTEKEKIFIIDNINSSFKKIKNTINPGEPLKIEGKTKDEFAILFLSTENTFEDERNIECEILNIDENGKIDEYINIPNEAFSVYISIYNKFGNKIYEQKTITDNKFSINLPALPHKTFFTGDEIMFPVKFSNYTKNNYVSSIVISERKSIKVSPNSKQIKVTPYVSGYTYFPMTFLKDDNNLKIAVGARSEGEYRETRGTLTVIPNTYTETSSSFGQLKEKYINSDKQNAKYKIEIYPSINSVIENACRKQYNKPQLLTSEIVGQKMLGVFLRNEIDISEITEKANKDGSFSNIDEADPIISSFVLRMTARNKNFAKISEQIKKYLKDSIKTLDEEKKSLLLYNLYMSGCDIKEYEKNIVPKEEENPAVYVLKSKIKNMPVNMDILKNKLMSFKDELYFSGSSPIAKNISQRQSDLDVTSIAIMLLDKKEIEQLETQKITSYLINSRLEDGTWGNSLRTWIVLSALKNLDNDKKFIGEITIKENNGDEIKEKFNEDENIKQIQTDKLLSINSEGNNIYPYIFIEKEKYIEELPPIMKKITTNFSKTTIKKGEIINCCLKWDMPQNNKYNYIKFTVPWGMKIKEDVLQIKNPTIQNYEIVGDDIIFLTTSEKGEINLGLKAVYPCKITAKGAEIQNCINQEIKGQSRNVKLEVNTAQ